jgi:trehalose 6-phosphate synthase/phosphatase
MAQVLIVSNRLPMSVKKVAGKLEFKPSIGGLATGLSSYVKGRKSIWVGWPGIASEELNAQEKQTITSHLAKHNCYPIFLTKHQVEDYYNGYSNSILWPVFHNMTLGKSTDADQERWWKAYRAVNSIFLDTILSLAQQGSTIWVHDYQLLLLPEMLRAKHVDGHIGFFLHIPFPDFKTFSKIAQTKQLLKGMLGADLVGFHTTSYSENFIEACQESNLGIAGSKQIILETRTIHVTNFPIGIDYEKYAQASKLKSVKLAVKRYRKKYGHRKMIVAVDRLEPSKGLTERLKAFRDFLEANPRFRNKVTMVMVAAPSRMDLPVYQQLKVRLEKLSQEINKKYGTSHWQPVDFINDSLPFEEVNALYQLADIAFIAPLRDGMNLVAKEFVASKHKNGILILSQTAGASEELREALLVDPKKPSTVVAALSQAMSMPKRELRSRLKSMQQQTSTNTIHTWASGFVKTLQQPVVGVHTRTHALKDAHLKRLLADYHSTQKHLILLDYDGTLIPFMENFKVTKPPKKIMNIMRSLAANPANEIVIISGRQAADLEEWFGKLDIHLVAEHGAVIKKAGAKNWKNIENVNTEWKKMILPILEKYTTKTPHAMIEIKPHSLVWHYRGSPSYAAQKNAVIIKRVLKPLLKKYAIQIYQGNKILEIKDPQINKGNAVHHWLSPSHDFILAIGDDYTDEDLFESLSNTAYTIKVGSGRTKAAYRLKSVNEVTAFLEKLNK